MRRYLRCPGAICCPARRALRAVLQPHPVLRRADRRRVEPTAPRMRRLSPPAGCGGCSVRGKRRRCLRVPHRCPCAFPRGRSTGLGVAGFAIRSRRGARDVPPRAWCLGRLSFAPGATADVKNGATSSAKGRHTIAWKKSGSTTEQQQNPTVWAVVGRGSRLPVRGALSSSCRGAVSRPCLSSSCRG